MPVFKIQHITKYKYDRPVGESANQIKIFSFNKPGQEILSHEIVITDEPNIINYFFQKFMQSNFCNCIQVRVFDSPGYI